MKTFPFLGPFLPDTPLAWYQGASISPHTFLGHLGHCLKTWPSSSHVINLCQDRYAFLLGFAASLLRKQITLLPLNRATESLQEIGKAYPGCFYLTDSNETISGIEKLSLNPSQLKASSPIERPLIPHDQMAVIAFTSGSTGRPRPNYKTWRSLVQIAQKTGQRLALELHNEEALTVVATVAHQHMYGLETSIMLPLQKGWAIYSGRPFFPEDIRSALATLPPKRILVSTPIHLRSCMLEHTQFPALESILSATAPLPQVLAHHMETAAQTKLTEIYGFSEAGTIATRQTARELNWQLLDGLELVSCASGYSVSTSYFPDPVPIPDSIQAQGPHEFSLGGRPSHMVNIGGHRTSLEELDEKLTSIESVTDGMFYIPDEGENPGDRLVAFVVAPGHSQVSILRALRKKCDPVFLPRPLIFLERLPRNPTGKLPRETLHALFQTHLSSIGQNIVS